MKKIIALSLLLISLGAVAGLVYGIVIEDTEYTNRGQLVVRNPKSLNQAKDYASIATSDTVLDYARRQAGLGEGDGNALKKYVTVTNVAGTNVIDVSVVTGDADLSDKIKKAVVDGIKEQADRIYDSQDLVDIDARSTSRITHEPRPLARALVGVFVGLFATAVAVFVGYPKRDNDSSDNASNEPRKAPLLNEEDGGNQQLAVANRIGKSAHSVSSQSIDSSRQSVHHKAGVDQTQGRRVSRQDKELDEILRSLDN